ncbi:MAG: CidA/LrgA family protein [Mangrovicoccus sp.]
MIWPLSLLLACQLAGEILSKGLALPLPGPVIGLVIFLGLLLAFPKLFDGMAKVSQFILSHLSLMYVPVGVGLVAHLDKLAQFGIGLLAAVIGSTVLALAAGVVTFHFVARAIEGKK